MPGLDRRSPALSFLAALLVLLVWPANGCSSAPEAPGATGQDVSVPTPLPRSGGDVGQPPATSPGTAADAPLVLFLGDSLTAGHGIDGSAAFPALVGQALQEEGLPVRVVNAGVSGDTTAGGLARLGWLLGQKPDVVVLELGANDGLHGQDLKMAEDNLREIIRRCREAGASVILAGMRIPTNYGPDYTEAFHAIFARVAEAEDVPLIPFLLIGVGGIPALNLPDGIHPTEEGHRIVARTVLPYVEQALKAR